MATSVEKRKIEFIQDFLRIQNEELLKKFEDLLKNERYKKLEEEFSTPLTEDAFNKEIDSAEEDVKNGRVILHSDVKNIVSKW